MNLKKTLAGLSAGVVAVASMATVAASAQEAGSKEFNTYDVKYQAIATFTVTAAIHATPANVVVNVTDFDAQDGWDLTSVEITKLKRAGDTYTDADEISVFASDDDAGTVTLSYVGLDAGKTVTATIQVKSDKFSDKDDATDLVDAYDDVQVVADADVTGMAANGAKVGKASVKAVSERVYLQIGGEVDGDNIDNEQWVSLTRYGASQADNHGGMNAAAPKMPQPELEGIGTEIANTLAANRGAKLVFYFEDKMEAEDDGLESGNSWSQDTGWSNGTTEDFAIRVNGTKALTGIGVVDKDALTISFDWDTVLAKSNLVNAVGQVGEIDFKANEEGFLYSEDYDDEEDVATYRYQITKIVVEWPASDAVAEDMSDLAAGEAETTVEAALPGADAAATTVAAATDAAANPSTGNSAVALAVIPVAIAAAAFVAKKRG